MRRTFVGLTLCLASSLSAQGTDRSASRELLDRARAALNDLQFARADSIARDLLSVSRLTRAVRAEALQVIAAANYPDPPAERREALSRSAISQLLQIDLGLAISREISTPGLDSLFQAVLLTTYATSVFVRGDNAIVGVDGAVPIRVQASRPSAMTVAMRTKDGIESIMLDSVSSARDTILRLRVARDGRVLLRGGEYEVVVTATDLVSRQSVVKAFDAVALIPALTFLEIPMSIDSAILRPERGRSERLGGIVGGILLGGATVAIGKGLRAPAPVRAGGETDRRYVAVGAAMAVAAGIAAWFDRGRQLDKGMATNRRAMGELASRQRAARDENARRAREYRASITLNPEWR